MKAIHYCIILWSKFEQAFVKHYTSGVGRPAKTNIIVGVVSHESNIHDNHTLPDVLSHIENSRGKEIKHAV